MRAVLSTTGGHRVDLDAFFAMMNALALERGWDWSHGIQPSAQQWLRGDSPFDTAVLHDLTGLHLKRGEAPRAIDASSSIKQAVAEYAAAGKGLVVVHHALASWPSWDGWADAIGARFSYAPGLFRGNPVESSATFIDTFRLHVVDPAHPICDGVEDFEITDEPYLFPVFESDVVPLVRSGGDRRGERFISTFAHVLVGEESAPRCFGRDNGSNLVAWATSMGNSPVAVIQPGDSGATFAHPMFRRLLGNAVDWSLSADARAWAAGRGRALDTER